MTTGASIFHLIEEVAATGSKLTKIGLLAQAKDSVLLQKVLGYTYDPFRNYGISNAPSKTREGQMDLTNDSVWMLLDMLASRAVTGNAARAEVQTMIDALNDPSAVVFQRIVNKDMRAGFSDTTIHKVFPKLLPELPYMRSSLPKKSNMDKWDWSDGIYVQLKADGMFANIHKDWEGNVWVTSRNGSRFPDEILGLDLTALAKNTQTHGELTVWFNGKLLPRKKGNGLLNSLLQGGMFEPGYSIVYDIWDQIPLHSVERKGKYTVPYSTRLADVSGQLKAGAPEDGLRLIDSQIVHSRAEAYAICSQYLKEGLEGVICKHPRLMWQDHTSPDQVKLKLEFTVELRVVGLNPGAPGTKTEATFGSLLCQSECGKLEVGVSGLTDADRARGDDWVGSIVTVTANDIMVPDGGVNPLHSLFLPRLEEERLDKTMADTLEQILAIKEGAINS